MIAEFSLLSAAIEAKTDRPIYTYVTDHGRRPDAQKVLRLRRQATLAIRPDKMRYSLAPLTDQWES